MYYFFLFNGNEFSFLNLEMMLKCRHEERNSPSIIVKVNAVESAW